MVTLSRVPPSISAVEKLPATAVVAPIIVLSIFPALISTVAAVRVPVVSALEIVKPELVAVKDPVILREVPVTSVKFAVDWVTAPMAVLSILPAFMSTVAAVRVPVISAEANVTPVAVAVRVPVMRREVPVTFVNSAVEAVAAPITVLSSEPPSMSAVEKLPAAGVVAPITVLSILPPLRSTDAAVRVPVTSAAAKVVPEPVAVSKFVILRLEAVTLVNCAMEAEDVPISVPPMLPPDTTAVPTVILPNSAVKIPVICREDAVSVPLTSMDVALIWPFTSNSLVGEAVPIPTLARAAEDVFTIRWVVFTLKSADTVKLSKLPTDVILGCAAV